MPVGSYTREVLGRLRRAEARRSSRNIRSNEPDVGGVVGKVTQGAVDAGFVYVTDVKATEGRAARDRAARAACSRSVAYGAAVVKGAKHPGEARAFVDGLLAGDGPRGAARAGSGRRRRVSDRGRSRALLVAAPGGRAGFPHAAGGGDLRRRRPRAS